MSVSLDAAIEAEVHVLQGVLRVRWVAQMDDGVLEQGPICGFIDSIKV